MKYNHPLPYKLFFGLHEGSGQIYLLAGQYLKLHPFVEIGQVVAF